MGDQTNTNRQNGRGQPHPEGRPVDDLKTALGDGDYQLDQNSIAEAIIERIRKWQTGEWPKVE